MAPMQAPAFSETSLAICAFSLLLVPFACAGLSLINTGLGRSRSAAHAMLASLCVIAVAAGAYFVWGFSLVGVPGRSGQFITLAGKTWNLIGAEPWFFRGLGFNGSYDLLAAWFGMISVALAALIPLGAGADRWRLGACCASTVLLAGVTYPLFAHDVWGGGWLAQLGPNCGLGRGFLDAGGSSAIQAVGGLTALSVAWILGPRRGKYTLEGMPTAIPGHNVVFVLLGCLLAWLGWLGLNSAGALLFAGIDPRELIRVPIHTTLAAGAAALTAAAITRLRFRKPDASLCANGWVSGLVASSAGCAFMTPLAAVVIGIVAAVLVIFSIEWLEARLGVDDPGGSISVHGLGGIWGVLAAGLFARFPGEPAGASSGQWLAQIVGIATLLGFVLPLAYGLNWLLDRFYRQRVDAEGERQGMDLYELGAGAYPEFATHTDEFTFR